MPIAPQQMETTAPTAKAIAVNTVSLVLIVLSPVKNRMMKNMMKTKIRQIKYSCFKN